MQVSIKAVPAKRWHKLVQFKESLFTKGLFTNRIEEECRDTSSQAVPTYRPKGMTREERGFQDEVRGSYRTTHLERSNNLQLQDAASIRQPPRRSQRNKYPTSLSTLTLISCHSSPWAKPNQKPEG